MTIACIIPARFNSSRFPGKLLAKAKGKTVLERTFVSALSHFRPEQLFVATDDERIADHVRGLGGQVVMTSPAWVNGTERIAEAVEKTPALKDVEIVVNLQGDHPCTKGATLEAAVNVLLQDPTAVMSTVATKLHSIEQFLSPHIVKVVVDRHQNALYFSRAPIPYTKSSLPHNALHHIGLYVFRRQFLLDYVRMPTTELQRLEDLEQLKVLENGHKIKVAVVDETPIGVDTPQDLVQLERML